MKKKMKHIRNLSLLLIALTLCAGSQSCTNWLDVQPIDQVLDSQAFENEVRINESLNGLYLTMATAKLYGCNLTFFTTELMAQRYNIPTNMSNSDYIVRSRLVAMTYTDTRVKNHFAAIFSKGYNLILNINLFIRKLEATEGKVADSYKKMMLGEAYALRAFMHFDLLRLFGPVPANTDNMAIPYVTEPTNDWQSRKTLAGVVAEIYKDLDKALELLANDPVRTNGVITGDDSDNNDPDFFYTDYRNRRMNYYAVQMLKTRVLAYEGKTTEAGELALILINDEAFQKAFPWSTSDKVSDGDKMFSDEVLFGIKVSDLYSEWEKYFSPAITYTNDLFGAARTNILYMFNIQSSGIFLETPDWRKNQYTVYTLSDYFLNNKYQKPASTKVYSYFQPLMRKSELYLLASEITRDEKYIDAVRENRGLKSLSDDFGTTTYDLTVQIDKEMMKETASEGQLLFYYKRLNRKDIRSYNGSGTNGMRSVSSSDYVAPYPAAELNQ